MKVVGTGFLSEEGARQAKQIAGQLDSLVNLVERSIQLCHQSLLVASGTGVGTAGEKQKTIACVVLARLLEISEAIVHLARGGFSVEVTSNTRNFLDAFFILGNIIKDPAFVPAYFNTDLAVRQKIINQAVQHKDELYRLTKEYATDETREQLKQEIRDLAAAEMNSYAYANNVGAGPIYDSLYRIFSAASHSSPRSLASYVEESPSGEVAELRRHPQLGDIPYRLLDVGSFLLNVRVAMDELFGNADSGQVQELRASFEAITLPE